MQGKIIGAGIGGLVAAIAFQKRGLIMNIYEAAGKPPQQGAGIILAVNAMRIMERLGIAEDLVRSGNEIHAVHITDEKLHPLSRNMIPSDIKRYGYTNVSVHRADLQNILLNRLEPGTIEWGKKCIRVLEKEQKNILLFEEGPEAYGDYVIAADGIHSCIRQQLFPGSKIRNAGQICWRGLVAFDLPDRYHHQAIEAWGRGRRFGFSKLNADLTYWFAVINKHGNTFNYGGDLRKELKKQFKDFDPLVAQMIEDTPEARINRKDLMDLEPLSQWYAGRTCLMGDAAHAITPNLGQGACQAIEDAWVLADLIDASKNPRYAFSQFQKIRKPVTDYAAKWSYRLGEIAHYENRFLTGFRNQVLRRIPLTFIEKRTARLLSPPYEI